MQVALCFFLFFCSAYAAVSPLRTEFEWKYFDYAWKSADQKNRFIKSGLYDYRNMTPIDVDRSADGRTFVTIIRSPGVPASLHTVTNKFGESGPLLTPYPDWSWYDSSSGCNGIISVYRVNMDYCNRMWVLDTGKIGTNTVCPPKLLVFDLSTNNLVMKKEIPRNIAEGRNGRGLLITPILEIYGQSCEHATVYIADVQGFGLVIWNHVFGFHRLEADEFKADENFANISIAGQNFNLADGVLGMSISPMRYPNEERILAFHSLASRSMYGAHVEVLKRSLAGERIRYYRGQNVLPSQATAMSFSSEGALIYGLTSEIGLGCWHMDNPWTPEFFRVALIDRERLQFVSGMKIRPHPRGEYVIMMSNRLQKVWTATTNFNEINFRITSAPVREIIRGTICEGPPRRG